MRLNRMFSCKTTPVCRRSQAGSTMREIDAVDQNAAAFGHVEPLDELGKGALSRSRRADNADDLAGRNRNGQSCKDLRAVEPVAEGDMLEGDVAADRRQGGASRRKARLGGVLRISPSRSTEILA